MSNIDRQRIHVTVLGVGGAGGNAIQRMAKTKMQGLNLIAINTDVQALNRMKKVSTLAIGPNITGGMGSGGDPKIGKKAIKESEDDVSKLIENTDMLFITAGMGGGTGSGAAPAIADIAKKRGILTIGVVTRPFTFEGSHRQQLGEAGLKQFAQKVDTLITVDNNRLISSLDGQISLEKAFGKADEVLRQGVTGISEILLVPGLINVDFADVTSVVKDGGIAFMAVGGGKGNSAASDAVNSALSNPLFEAPLLGAKGILLNIKGGNDLSLDDVNNIAQLIKRHSRSHSQIILGVVQDRKWNNRVSLTLVATGVEQESHLKQPKTPRSSKDIQYIQFPGPSLMNPSRHPRFASPNFTK